MIQSKEEKGKKALDDTRKGLTSKNLIIFKLKCKQCQNKGCLASNLFLTDSSLQDFFFPPVCVEIFDVAFQDYVFLEKTNQNSSVISDTKARKKYAALPTALYQLTFNVSIEHPLIYLGLYHKEFCPDFQCFPLVKAIALCV